MLKWGFFHWWDQAWISKQGRVAVDCCTEQRRKRMVGVSRKEGIQGSRLGDSVWNSGSQSVWIGKSSNTGGVPGWEPGSGVDTVGDLGPRGWLGLPWSALRAARGSCNNLHQYIDQWSALLTPLHVCLQSIHASSLVSLPSGLLCSSDPLCLEIVFSLSTFFLAFLTHCPMGLSKLSSLLPTTRLWFSLGCWPWTKEIT